jgi:hypothetical protein
MRFMKRENEKKQGWFEPAMTTQERQLGFFKVGKRSAKIVIKKFLRIIKISNCWQKKTCWQL